MANRILIKREKTVQVDGRERVISDFEKHYIDSNADFHSKHGVIRKQELAAKPGSIIKSGNTEFTILDADFIDDYKHIRRQAQIITLKDLGLIITNTGINRNSKILEAGVGSGAATIYLGMIAKKVVSYDNDERSLDTAKENIAKFNLKNVSVKKGDVYDEKTMSEKGFDVFLLDLPEPWQALPGVRKSLKVGGFIAVYLPNVSQVQCFVNALGDDFLVEKIVEVVEREWVVDDKRTRPATKDHGHTAFLTFVRKIR